MKTIFKSGFFLAVLACAALYAGTAGAETVTRSVTTNPDGSIVHSKTVTSDDYAAPMPVATTTTTTTSRTYTTYQTYAGANDDSYILRSDRRVGDTYAQGEDAQGNNTLRYENKTFDGYNN